jgi:hypothetical protein
MGHITNDFAKRLAAHSMPAVMAAIPIEPLPNEHYPGQYINFSPQRFEDTINGSKSMTNVDASSIGWQPPESNEDVEDALHEDNEQQSP